MCGCIPLWGIRNRKCWGEDSACDEWFGCVGVSQVEVTLDAVVDPEGSATTYYLNMVLKARILISRGRV